MDLSAGLHSRVVRAAGLDVRVLEAGEGPPVLFVHGFPTHAGLWRHVLRAVAQRGRRAIALDLPAFGASDKPVEHEYTFAFYAALFDDLLDALEVDRLGLCLHDAGGPFGLHWAVDRAKRIERLCLLNTLVFPDLSLAARALFVTAALPLGHQLIGHPVVIALGMRVGVRTRRLDAATLEAYVAPFRDPAARRAYARAVRTLDLDEMPQIAAGLTRFAEIPVRLLYGARDVILPDVAQTMRRVEEVLPQSALTELPHLGHFLQEDDPEGVASAVAAFFGERSPD